MSNLTKFSFLLLILVIGFSSCKKDEIIPTTKEVVCSSERYTSPVFTEVTRTTVQYGSNKNTLGQNQNLMMDIYQPVGDTLSKRAVMMLSYGGSFVGGNRTQLADLAKELTNLGYVAVCIDYRLLSLAQLPIDSVKGLDIAVKAATDLKAAIRHMRKDAATANLYKIDPDMILAGGLSAGSIATIQAAYFDESDNVEQGVKDVVTRNGGVEGNSGDSENLKYSSKIQGVVNMSGAVYRTAFIDKGEAPIASFHGDADDVVPYGYGFVSAFGIKVIPLYGSSEIHKHCNNIGVTSSFSTVMGGGHDNIYTAPAFANAFSSFKTAAYKVMKEVICQ